jgi:hypothetical protein
MDWVLPAGFLLSGIMAACFRTEWLRRILGHDFDQQVRNRLAALEGIAKPFREARLSPAEVRDFLVHEVPRVMEVKEARNDINEIALEIRTVPEQRNLSGTCDIKRDVPKLLCKYGTKPLDDARHYPRYSSHVLVNVSFQVSNRWHPGFMQDVSVRGLCLFTAHEVRVGTRLRLIVNDLGSQAINGRVKWAKRDAEAARLLRVGIELEEDLILDD